MYYIYPEKSGRNQMEDANEPRNLSPWEEVNKLHILNISKTKTLVVLLHT